MSSAKTSPATPAQPKRPRGAMHAKTAFFIAGAFWITVYVSLSIAPLVLILLGPAPEGRSFWLELSVALGFIGLTMMTLQFALTGRLKWLKSPYGSDVVYTFHRQISLVATGFILAHIAILLAIRPADTLNRLNIFTGPAAGQAGVAAVVLLALLVVASVFRQRLRIGYETWRWTHALLAVAAVGFAAGHIVLVNHYLQTTLQRWLWLLYVLYFVGIVVWIRMLRPILLRRHPWVVVEVVPQRGGAVSLSLRPKDHPGLRFQPGQFAWITFHHSPFSDREHPFSFSSSAELAPDRLQFTVKALGDSTSDYQKLKPGEIAYIDGPYGSLSVDRYPDTPGFVLIAGGVGITPMMSQIRTLADRRDTRPLTLVYASNEWDDVMFREELEVVRERLNLRVVHVLSTPPDGWTGEQGYVDADLLKRHLPPDAERLQCFICGPQPMMDAAERALHDLGVPITNIHSERFNLV